MKKNQGHIDWFILLPVVGIMLFSIAFVYSASATKAEVLFGSADTFFWKHSFKILIGIAVVLIFAKIDYHKWMKMSMPLLFTSIILLILVLVSGKNVNGATRWIDLGPIDFQPSELAKYALVLHFARLLTIKKDVIKNFEIGFLPFLFWTGSVCFLIALQPNYSTMMVVFMLSMGMLFVGNTNILHLGATAIAGFIASAVYAVSAPYRVKRLLSFFGIGSETDGQSAVSYQLDQALIAIGNGGIFGLGPGQNRQSHKFLPESFGDFIYSIIGEEYGFMGTSLIILVFMFIFWRGVKIAKNAPDDFGYFLSIGIIFTFAIYVFVNAGVNTGLLPTTGVPMPFISYGGTAVIFNSAAIGILLNISSQSGVYPKNQYVQDK